MQIRAASATTHHALSLTIPALPSLWKLGRYCGSAARTIADLLRCDLLPTCHVLPPEMRDLRRRLRYRNMVVQQSVRMQNKMAGLLMESGATFLKDKLHGKKYFSELIRRLEEVPEWVKDLLRMSRGSIKLDGTDTGACAEPKLKFLDPYMVREDARKRSRLAI